MIISKFGGSSMASYEVMNRASHIIDREGSNFVVVSATFKTTDQLIYLIEQSTKKNWPECVKKIFSLKEKHFDITEKLNNPESTNNILKELFRELEAILHGISLLGECTLQARDKVLSFGEQLSSSIFYAILKEAHPTKNIKLVDAKTIIKTDSFYGEADPILDEIRKSLTTLNDKETLYLTQGFIGSSLDGKTTTLGRGGSDYSAALIAEAFQATTLQIWTDIDGMNTIDPRVCDSSSRIDEITYDEASEFAYLGAKILHPITLLPARRSGVPVYIGSTLIDFSKGTQILKSPKEKPLCRGIALLKEMSKITLTNTNNLKFHLFLKKSLTVLEKNKIDIIALSTAQKCLSFYSKTETSNKLKFEDFAHAIIQDNQSVISLIGNDLNNQKITALLKDEGLIKEVISGASEHSLTLTCNLSDSEALANSLHQRLFQ